MLESKAIDLSSPSLKKRNLLAVHSSCTFMSVSTLKLSPLKSLAASAILYFDGGTEFPSQKAGFSNQMVCGESLSVTSML